MNSVFACLFIYLLHGPLTKADSIIVTEQDDDPIVDSDNSDEVEKLLSQVAQMNEKLSIYAEKEAELAETMSQNIATQAELTKLLTKSLEPSKYLPYGLGNINPTDELRENTYNLLRKSGESFGNLYKVGQKTFKSRNEYLHSAFLALAAPHVISTRSARRIILKPGLINPI